MQKHELHDELRSIFMDACDRWDGPKEVREYLKGLKGTLVVGDKAAKILCNHVLLRKKHVLFTVVDELPFTSSESPAAIILPERTAFRIVALGGIP
jgi:hypothetical protein